MRNVRTLNMFQRILLNWRKEKEAATTGLPGLVGLFARLGLLISASAWVLFILLYLVFRADFLYWLVVSFGMVAFGTGLASALKGLHRFQEAVWLLGGSLLLSSLIVIFGAGLNNPALALLLVYLLLTLSATLLTTFSKSIFWGQKALQPTELMITIGRLEGELEAVRATFDSLEEGLLLTDAQDKILRTNRYLTTIFGLRSEGTNDAAYSGVLDWMNRVRAVASNGEEFKSAFLQAREMVRRGETSEFVFGIEKPNPRFRAQTPEPSRVTVLPTLADENYGRNLPLLPVYQEQSEPKMGFERDTRELLYREIKLKVFPVLGPKGNLLGVCYLARDVTEEREVEQMKDNFISIVSHEVRTPMAVILGLTELLALPGVERSEQEEWIHAINQEAVRLRTVLNDMQSIARIKEGALELSVEEVDLKEVIERVVKVTQLQYRSKHSINLQLELESVTIMTDRGKVTQVLTNLIGNAIKYTPDEGEIKIRVGQRPTQPEQLFVSVTDQGIGIPQSEHHKIFSRFFRSSSARQKGIGGTGLGLAITMNLVKLMGGTVWFESEEGKGSTFYFSLPYTLPETPLLPDSDPTPRPN